MRRFDRLQIMKPMFILLLNFRPHRVPAYTKSRTSTIRAGFDFHKQTLFRPDSRKGEGKRKRQIVLDEGRSDTTTEYTITPDICLPTDTLHLRSVVEKHCQTLDRYLYNKPVARHTKAAFCIANEFMQDFMKKSQAKGVVFADMGIVLDNGCGTGKSTLLLAQENPQHFVLGIDRSFVRLNRNKFFRNYKFDNNKVRDAQYISCVEDDYSLSSAEQSQSFTHIPNALLLRAESSDFWRCCLEHDENKPNEFSWTQLMRHQLLLYPNPYPKLARLKNRWYAHPAFPLMLKLGGQITVRSNWNTYLEEFKFAVGVWNEFSQEVNEVCYTSQGPNNISFTPDFAALTNFEEKFLNAGEKVFELKLQQETSR